MPSAQHLVGIDSAATSATTSCTPQAPAIIRQPFDWPGKSLQLIQSLALILTFWIAFAERQRNRRADQFGDTVVKFATVIGDKLYSDTQALLEGLPSPNGTFFSADEFERNRKRVLASFSREMFHTRTLLDLRVKLFAHCDPTRLNTIFEELEDGFTLGVAGLTANDEHPEALTMYVAEATSKLLAYLMEREAALEKDTTLKRFIAACRRIDRDLRESS